MNFGIIGIGYWGKNVLRNLIIHPKIKNVFVLDKEINAFACWVNLEKI